MKTVINVNYLSIEDDGYVKTIGFSNDGDSPTEFVIIQKSHKYDDQDKSLGMDKAHFQIESGSISASFYGGVKKIFSSSGKIVFFFDDACKKNYAIDGDVELAIERKLINLDDALSGLEDFSECDGVKFVREP
jgi:Immunity protein 10